MTTLHVGIVGIGQIDALSRREHDFARRRGDDAGVGDIGRDQVNLAAARGGDGAPIADIARLPVRPLRVPLKSNLPARKSVLLRFRLEADQAADVDLRAGSEQHAVGVDQEHFAVRLQRAEYLRRVLPGDAIQHAARGTLLDEPRELARADRETLPVDDGAGRVGDQKLIAGADDGDLAGDDLRTGRIGERGAAVARRAGQQTARAPAARARERGRAIASLK